VSIHYTGFLPFPPSQKDGAHSVMEQAPSLNRHPLPAPKFNKVIFKILQESPVLTGIDHHWQSTPLSGC